MSGGIAIVVTLVVLLPVTFTLIGGAIAIALGGALASRDDAAPEDGGDGDARS
jgi:hypothetical protein